MEYQRLYARVDLDAIGKNVAGARARIPENTGIMAVIKANAYGHGAVALAKYLDDKTDWYGVATVDEAVELRTAGVEKDILVLGCLDPCEYKAAIENNITVTVASLADAEKLSSQAQQANRVAKVHIKVDTGMSRIGFQANDENALEVKKVSELPGICIDGIFTHFAIADSSDKTSALLQRDKYDAFVSKCRDLGVEFPICHVNNSAGTMELDRHYDMVRMGIMLYGLYPSEEMDKSYPLYPAMELWGHISFVKKLEAGRGISYGHTFVTDREMRVATVPCGYADGYPRVLSSNAEVLIKGKRCKILGRVCMDQMMVDVTDVPDALPGDDVVLFGRMGDEFIPVEELANKACSFNYEFVCGIARRVPRVYFNGEKYLFCVNYLNK
ncbi:MAG: alanine racemase [Ruminococcaceae bacterium]|nr:alanine racemase [Oscillospiraceae bacterium]